MLNWADLLIIVVLVISSFIGARRGFVKEALSLATWIIALLIASFFSPKLAPLFNEYIDAPSMRHMAAFAILFVLTLICGGGVNFLLSSLIKVSGLSGTDRFLGVLFGLVRGSIIVMLILIYAPLLAPFDQDDWWQRSALISFFLEFEMQFRVLMSSVYSYLSCKLLAVSC